MSILGQASGSGGGGGSVWGELLLIAPLCLVSLAVAWWAGIFRRGRIVGPPRLSEREPLAILVLVMACTFVLWMMVQIVCVAAGASVRGASSATAPATTPTFQSKFDISPKTMALASSLPGLIGAAVMLVAHALLRRDGLRKLGIAMSQLPRGIGYGLIGSLIMVPLVFLSAELTELAWRMAHYTHPTEHELLRVMNEAKGVTVAVLIASAVLIAPIFEEMFFRGHVQTVLAYVWPRIERWRRGGSTAPARGFEVIMPPPPDQPMLAQMAPPEAPLPPPLESPKAWQRWVAVVVTSLLFSLVHPVWSMPPIFLLAVCLGYAYERTGNLWTTITMHAMFNTTSTLLFIFTR
jgi:membrane protease YdiL (CAAX protease family)